MPAQPSCPPRYRPRRQRSQDIRRDPGQGRRTEASLPQQGDAVP